MRFGSVTIGPGSRLVWQSGEITINMVRAFAVPRAGRLHPSAPTPYESPALLAKRLPVGGAGAGEGQ